MDVERPLPREVEVIDSASFGGQVSIPGRDGEPRGSRAQDTPPGAVPARIFIEAPTDPLSADRGYDHDIYRDQVLPHLINHHETEQSGTTPGPLLEKDDDFETELVEIKPTQRGRNQSPHRSRRLFLAR